ncbi:hypothetical protein BKA64DRAFT_276244 [Cadophora sp. MPI-SDFR-AT-0126]|nr:hypothetical protein BKA64DRAFT_276244 [Leotiomycetes sp. MPI-SDFR-AT-0126]
MSSGSGQLDEAAPGVSETGVKTVRKGTRSCTECRHRKVRCVWPSEGASTCQGCLARRKTCQVQVRMRRTNETVANTSRARLQQLEKEVSSLWNVVQQLEGRLNGGNAASHSQPAVSTLSRANPPVESPNEIPSDEEDNFDSDDSALSTTNTPIHLLHLFDNGLLEPESPASNTSFRHHTNVKHAHNIAAFQKVMPSREITFRIAAYATPWLRIYNLLFPQSNIPRTSQDLLAQYDRSCSSTANLLELASLLVSLALTVQQFPDDFIGEQPDRMRNPLAFVKDVSELVERTVANDDVLGGTVDGIGTTLLYLRLQLGHAPVTKMWLVLRRIVALAELNGLPRAATALNRYKESISGTQRNTELPLDQTAIASLKMKADVWTSICAIDRVQALMWSLPLATAKYPLPKQAIIDANGQVDAQAFQYTVIELTTRLLEVDEMNQAGRPLAEIFQAVIEIDQQMRALNNLTPKGWHRIEWSELNVYAILQYWQQYMNVRIHLQLALRYDGQEFAFSFITCLGAAQELAKRYISLRPLLAPGFFANRVLDLQAFTGIVFLILAVARGSLSPGAFLQTVDATSVLELVDKAVDTMRCAAARAAGDFARQAADSICSLRSLLLEPQTSKSRKITLHLALVGKIHVSRKSRTTNNVATYALPDQQQQQGMSWQASNPNLQAVEGGGDIFAPSVDDLMDSLSYSIEIPENYPFFADQTSGSEPWLTWSGLDGNT